MTKRGRPLTDCPISSTERTRRYRERQRRGVACLPPIPLSEERRLELAALLKLPLNASPEDIAEAIENKPLAVTRSKSAD